MIYKNSLFGDSKVFSVSENYAGTWLVKEYVNKCKKSEMTLSKENSLSFINKLESNGWKEKVS
mgnify:FL=1|tara:strand:- start:3410 stop:3598 length:189 start_codon:yes stop_codon:yes gene_type:complete